MENQKGRRVTLKEVARATGYSVITVSKALRDMQDISHATKELIRQKAREMGYVNNGAANALRSGRTNTVAISVVDISNPYWSIFCKVSEEIARSQGYMTLLINTDMEGETEKTAIRTAIERGTDGILMDPSVYYETNIELLRASNIPFVLVGHSCHDGKSDAVFYENEQGGYLAAQKLIELGRRRIMHLNLPAGIRDADSKERGVRRAMKEAGMPEDALVICRFPKGQGLELDAFRQVFEAHPDIDGIVAYNDFSAMKTICHLWKMGKRVPEDVTVIGHDDLQESLCMPFHMYTVNASAARLAEESMRLLLSRVQGDTLSPPRQIQLPVRLVER